MKILVLPSNTASMPSISVESFNKIEGVEAKGLFIGIHKYQFQGTHSTFIKTYPKSNPLKWLYFQIKKTVLTIQHIFWADAVYYVWNNNVIFNIDLFLLHLLNKPRLVEWMGSEIRIPDIAITLNPNMKEVYKNGYEYLTLESRKNSYKIQTKFQKYGFTPIAISEIDLYIDRTLFPHRYITFQRLNISDFYPVYPAITNTRPVILHSPTAPIGKGTNYILPVIEDLKKEYDFEFILLQNMDRSEVLTHMSTCDIFLDQLNTGIHGLASTEAMALGKPVMCYLMPAVFENGFPSDCPIVNTNKDNLKEQLVRLITNPSLRHELGIKSRAYAEKYHDADKIAKDVHALFLTLQKN